MTKKEASTSALPSFDALIKEVQQWYAECNVGTIQHITTFGQRLGGLKEQLGPSKFRELTEHNKDAPAEDRFPIRYQMANDLIKIAECPWITDHPERWPKLPCDKTSLAAIAKLGDGDNGDKTRNAALRESVINPEATAKSIQRYRNKPKKKKKSVSSQAKHGYTHTIYVGLLTAKENKQVTHQLNLVLQDLKQSRADIEYEITCVKDADQSGDYGSTIMASLKDTAL